jgi:transcriptional regulator with XRE-family HTH domain
MNSFGARFGKLIREKRGIEGFSQDALAAKSELTKARISELETGRIAKPQAKTVDKLCVALNISREERDACYSSSGPRLPPPLLENIALRFGLSNPEVSEDELQSFLREKANEYYAMQQRLSAMDTAAGETASFLGAAKAALERGNFELADASLAEAENTYLMSITLPALNKHYDIRLERGHAALLAGEIEKAAQHWESAVNYFGPFDAEMEAERRHNYCTSLRAYGYRYKNSDALYAAEKGLVKNLAVWTREKNLERWCRTKVALGGTQWRLSQYDDVKNYRRHIDEAMSLFDEVASKTSNTNLSFWYSAAISNIANIYSDAEFAISDDEYASNLEKSLSLQLLALECSSQTDQPDEWGILQHNIGLTYIHLFGDGNRTSIDLIDAAIRHLELSFDVRKPATALQYWIASCRSLGEALIERSLCPSNSQSGLDLERASRILSKAESAISELDHPNQWAELQTQIQRCSKK